MLAAAAAVAVIPEVSDANAAPTLVAVMAAVAVNVSPFSVTDCPAAKAEKVTAEVS